MDPGHMRPLWEIPRVKLVIRRYDPDYLAQSEVYDGAAGAYRQFKRIEPWLRERPWLASPGVWFEHHNEPSNFGALSTPERRVALANYGAALTGILWQELGIRSVAGNLGVGHPEPEHAVQVCAAPMAELLKTGGLYSFHGYGWPLVLSDWIWYTLRYLLITEELKQQGAREIPRLILGEVGIDKLIIGEIGGWQVVNNDPRWYAVQLEALSRLLVPLVRAAFVFTATPYHPWETYKFTEALAWEIAKRWECSA